MTIFCTGSSGLVASQFKQLALGKNINFIGLDLHSEEMPVDILDEVGLIKAIEPKLQDQGILFHFAAATFTGNNLSQDQKDISWQLNIEGTQNVLATGAKLNIPVAHISTDYVFAGGNKTEAYLSSDPIAPDDTVYAQSKAKAGKLVLKVKNDQQVNIIRIAFPYGNVTHPKMGLMRKMLSWMDKSETVDLYLDQQTSPTPINFISQSCLRASEIIIDNKIDSGQILHVVGQATTPYDFGSLIKEIFDKKVVINPIEIGDKGFKNLALDTRETEKILDLKAPSHEDELTMLKLKCAEAC